MTTALRADAERNRGLVLEAARAVCAEQGADACVADIAERAGVGVGTLFRRFPHKDDLVAALVAERMQEIAALARSARSFREFMAGTVRLHMGDRCLCDVVDRAVLERPELDAARREVRTLVRRLLRDAQAAGEVRKSVTVDDVPVIVLGVARSAPPDRWRRYLDFALDGLRPR
jgi:AcrR family transcriptional regulator